MVYVLDFGAHFLIKGATMRTHTLYQGNALIFGTCICTLLLAAGCGLATPTWPGPNPDTKPTPTPAPAPVSTTEPLAAPGVAMPIPANLDDGGEFFVAANNAPPDTTVSITTNRSAPPGAPHTTTKNNIFLWVKHTYSNPVTFQAFPHTHYIINSAITCSVTQETFNGGSWIVTEHPAQIHGDYFDGMTIDFSGAASQFNVQPADTYWWVLGFDPKGALQC